jgi:hypothetical protein
MTTDIDNTDYESNIELAAETQPTSEETPTTADHEESSRHAERISHVGGVTLLDDEELLFDLSPGQFKFRWTCLKWGLISLVTFGLGLLVAWYPIWKAYRASKKRRYLVTTERIVLKDAGTMFGAATTQEHPIRSITDVQTSASWIEQRFDRGTVTFRELDGADSTVTFESIPDHEEVASTLGAYQRRNASIGRHYAQR